MAEVNLDNLLNGVQGKFWNYSNQQRDGYMPSLQGTLVKVSISQAHEFGHPEQKSYWPDGNPVIMLRMHIRDSAGEEYLFDIKPKSNMWFEDIQPACPEGSLSAILGKLIQLDFLGLVPVTGKSVNRNKFKLTVLGDGQWPNQGFDNKMPPTRQEAQGMAAPQQPAAPSPQQYTAQRMVAGTPQQQAQQAYNQQAYNMPPQLQQSLQQAQQAGAAGQAQMIQSQFPGAQVAMQPQVDPVDPNLWDRDIPFN